MFFSIFYQLFKMNFPNFLIWFFWTFLVSAFNFWRAVFRSLKRKLDRIIWNSCRCYYSQVRIKNKILTQKFNENIIIFEISIKSIIAFSTGMQLVSAKIAKKFVVTAIFIFSIMAPLGIGIGFLVRYDFQNSF